MEIALWLVYADWGMLLLPLQPVAALIFIYISPLCPKTGGLQIYAQARAADSYFFAFNKASAAKLLGRLLGDFLLKIQFATKCAPLFAYLPAKFVIYNFRFVFLLRKPHKAAGDLAAERGDDIVSRNALYQGLKI